MQSRKVVKCVKYGYSSACTAVRLAANVLHSVAIGCIFAPEVDIRFNKEGTRSPLFFCPDSCPHVF